MQNDLKGMDMETEKPWRRERQPGEILAIILYWAGWCAIAANVLCLVWALYTQDFPEKARLQVAAVYVRSMVTAILGALVLFGISAVLKATNANTREIRKLASKEGQQG